MAEVRKDINVVLNARDQASKVFSRVGRKAGMLSKAFGGLKGVLAGFGLGLGAIGAAKGLAGIFTVGAGFEKEMSRVGALTSATRDEMEFLTRTAEKLGATTVFTARQSSEAMSQFALAGFKVNEIVGSMKPALDLAAAGQLTIQEASSITTRTMRGFGLSV